LWGISEESDFFNGTDANAVSFAQSAIDRTGFSHTHFSAMNQPRNIGGIGIAIANEAGGSLRRVNRCLENEPACTQITKGINGFDVDPAAFPTTGQSQQSRMRYVPSTLKENDVSRCN
jgi:hypothetical protein